VNQRKTLIWITILLPIISFYAYVNHYAVNIGWNDDFHGIEGFLASWMQQETWGDKIALLFSQMCEHRILYVRLSTLLGYNLLGEVNYKFMMLMGVSYLLILPFIFRRVLQELNLGLVYLIPIIFIIFNIQPIENIFWAITSLQPNVVIIFGLWAFSLLLFTKKSVYFYLANILMFVAMFTNGNGMFAFLAAIPIVLIQRTKSEKIQYFAFVIFSFWLYFHDFQKVGIRPDPIINITKYPHYIVANFFSFFGSPIDSTVQFYSNPLKYTVAITTGVLMIGWCLFLIGKFLWKYYRSQKNSLPIGEGWGGANLFLLSSFIFVGLSGAAFAVSRAIQGLDVAFASRYKTVSIILFIIVYLSLLNFVKKEKLRKFLIISILTTGLFNLFSYYAASDDVLNYRRFLTTNMLNWKNNGRYYYYAFGDKSRYPKDDHEPISSYQKLPIPPLNYAGFVPGVMKYVNDILWISRKHYKNYTPPKELEELDKSLFENQIQAPDSSIIIKDEVVNVRIQINNNDSAMNPMQDGYYAVFKEVKHNSQNGVKLVFPLNSQANKFTTFLSTRQYFNSIIDVNIAKPDFPSGAYTMQIGQLKDGQFYVKKTGSVLIK
jgi:hypothetical protein